MPVDQPGLPGNREKPTDEETPVPDEPATPTPVPPSSEPSEKTPEISTNADFAEGSHEVVANSTVVDTVTYEGLVPGKQYTLSAELISKADGKTVLGKGEKTFTPAESAGTEDVTITVNDDVTEPVEAAVAFEELTSTEVNDKGEDTPDVEKPNKVAEHKDITDKDQTVTSKGSKKTPEISTDADFAEGSHQVIADSTVIDTVTYEGLVPEKEYTLSAELISKADGTTVLGKGEKTFTPEKSEGSVDVEITVDSDVTEPVEAAVAFEELTSTEVNEEGEDTPDVEKPNKVAEHKDITDKDQTVTSKGSKKTPEISTDADFAEGSHEVVAGAEIIDTVSYEGLVPGKQYTLSAELISKEDGTTVLGKGEKTFTPAESAGTEDVTITVNDDVTEPVEAAVAFEELISTEVNDKGEDTPDAEQPNKVAEHKDIDDKDQTVTSEECDNPGDKPNKGKIPWWAILIPGIGLGKIIHDHRHEGDHDQPKDHHKDHSKGSNASEQQSKGNGDNHTPGNTGEDQTGDAGQSAQGHVPGKTGTPLPADAGRTEIKSVPSGATELDPGVQGYIK
ncbi:VaFE repeat-containing surface-anchored protein [Corynebacterium accolens]|uniref:VaFE repeat-containing surface-anchored protein n=1 Tax=Corynebacterium accolens TaxID=38284 RepID=UPI001EDC25CF|nr:VaFE repeat-containing surface-anchored protein [Corynebacterium accolens]